MACGPRNVPELLTVEAEVSEDITTVINVNWMTDIDAVSYVEYGANGSFTYQTPLEKTADTCHTASLMGIPEETEASYRVVSVVDGEEYVGETQTVTTGALPIDVPAITVEGDGNDRFMAVPVMGSTTAPLILSPEGEVVWYWLDDRGLEVFRVRLSVDGQSVLYNAASVSGDPAEDSELVRVKLDGSEETTIPVPLLAHDFVEHQDGTIGTIVVEYGDQVDEETGEYIRGDQIVEVAPDGTQSVIWSAWDCFDPEDFVLDSTGWTFANALDYDAEEQAYYLGTRNLSSIIKIDRQTGECLWVMGGDASTFTFGSGSEQFLHQHQFEVRDDTILVFDNEGAAGTVSRAIEYTYDEQTQQMDQIWSYTADPALYTFVLGDVARLEDEQTLVTWSVLGQIDRATTDGDVVWQANTAMGAAFGFNTVLDSLYAD